MRPNAAHVVGSTEWAMVDVAGVVKLAHKAKAVSQAPSGCIVSSP